MANILLVDDSEITIAIMEAVLREAGHQVDSAGTLAEGMAKLGNGTGHDLVLLDVMLPDGNGLDSIPRIRALPGRPEIIVITSQGDPEGATAAIQEGVWDYIEKGTPADRLAQTITRALEYRASKAGRGPARIVREGIVGDSPQIRASLELLAVAASSEANVLIMGETGTGKELFARALHKSSKRGGGPFVVVDCAALPRDVADSILFGHVKGAFTSADRSHEGLIAKANGGTLFLDELGELPLSLQKAFLRVLQEGTYRQVGGSNELKSDFRVVAATNRDINALVEQNAFRSDLLYRLNVFNLQIPALRLRQGDIRTLTQYFLDLFVAKYELEEKDVARDLLEALEAYPWPGNVRELMNTVEKAAIQARYETKLFAKHLPVHIRQHHARARLHHPQTEPRPEASPEPGPEQLAGAAAAPARESGAPPADLPTWREVRDNAVQQAARGYFPALMKSVRGDMKRASELSGMSVPNLYASLRKHKVTAKKLVYGE
ncbi:MAG: sigma-54-dependent Fis family transcriptional regulator [Desulfovibrio sp.]|jgi:two-component system NtrC family response regulator|nr:sigma-54-dependent Fis family transcriptional regulator [Desulfovibrio sp.]